MKDRSTLSTSEREGLYNFLRVKKKYGSSAGTGTSSQFSQYSANKPILHPTNHVLQVNEKT